MVVRGGHKLPISMVLDLLANSTGRTVDHLYATLVHRQDRTSNDALLCPCSLSFPASKTGNTSVQDGLERTVLQGGLGEPFGDRFRRGRHPAAGLASRAL